jgi:hypothetical protein
VCNENIDITDTIGENGQQTIVVTTDKGKVSVRKNPSGNSGGKSRLRSQVDDCEFEITISNHESPVKISAPKEKSAKKAGFLWDDKNRMKKMKQLGSF